MIGLFFFHDAAHGHSHGGGGGGGHGHAHGGGSGRSSSSSSDHHGHSHGRAVSHADDDHHGHSHGGGGSGSSCHGHGGHSEEAQGHAHGPATKPQGGGSSANENMYGVYLHVMADALGSVGVIISSLLIQFYGWQLADPVASLMISILILLSVGPLVSATVAPLLSRVPEHLEGDLADACAHVARMPGVNRVDDAHFWKQHGDAVVGTLRVVAAADADEQRLLRRVRAALTARGVSHLTVQIEKEPESASGGTHGGGHGSAADAPHAAAPAAVVSASSSGGDVVVGGLAGTNTIDSTGYRR
jgi:zinc transporter 5/7